MRAARSVTGTTVAHGVENQVIPITAQVAAPPGAGPLALQRWLELEISTMRLLMRRCARFLDDSPDDLVVKQLRRAMGDAAVAIVHAENARRSLIGEKVGGNGNSEVSAG